jgi:hypothetical protein
MAKHLRLVEREFAKRSGAVEGRVEILERYGSNAGGSGMELVWRGIGKVVKGALCTAFPFMERWFDEATETMQQEKGKGRTRGKKAKRLRATVNNLPPVPEEVDDPRVINGIRDGHAKVSSGIHATPRQEQASGPGTWLISVVTWPLRLMRGIVVGWFGIMRG